MKVDRMNDVRKGSLDQNERIKREVPLERRTEKRGSGNKAQSGIGMRALSALPSMSQNCNWRTFDNKIRKMVREYEKKGKVGSRTIVSPTCSLQQPLV